MKTFFVTVMLSILPTIAFATIEGEADVQIPYTPAQAGMGFDYMAQEWSDPQILPRQYCMATFMYYDHYNSSSLPSYEFMMKPFVIPSFPYQFGDVQINTLADGKLKVETDWEKFDKYVQQGYNIIHEPEFEIDVSAYDQSTKAGRLEAITMAKLAVISLHYNMAFYGGLFRLKVTITGLPADQNEFKKAGWTKIKAQTQYPYSGPSPVAQNFYDELIASDFCQSDYDQAKGYANP